MSYPFKFSLTKAFQAVAVLLEQEAGQRMNYMRLLKLLYIAEREALKRTGRAITGDFPIAMERGPLPEATFQLIKGEHESFKLWSAHFARQKFDLQIVDNPGHGALSPFEIELLQEVSETHVGRDEWDLVKFTHTLPEWIKNNPGTSSKSIPIEDIFDAIGRHDLKDVEAEAEEDDFLDSIFGEESRGLRRTA